MRISIYLQFKRHLNDNKRLTIECISKIGSILANEKDSKFNNLL